MTAVAIILLLLMLSNNPLQISRLYMSRHVRSPDQSDFGTSRSMILFRVSDSDPERVLRICHPVRVSPLDLCTSLIRSARSSSAFLIQYPMGRWGLFLSDMVPGIICSFND